MVAAQEAERRRIALELHDGVGQILTGIKFRLQSLAGMPSRAKDGEEAILAVGAQVDHVISEIRRLSRNLMPPELEDLGLEPALLKLCREYRDCTGGAMTARIGYVEVAPEPALALFRIAQEALNNVVKHARATAVTVDFEREGDDVVLRVSDDGVGFVLDPVSSVARGIGLGSMRERAESLGGSIELLTGHGAGTTLSVHVPARGTAR